MLSQVDGLVAAVGERSQSLTSLDPLIERIADGRVVLLGEASHGTHEYYTWRARISQRLIQDHGFSFIAVEGDWPDCYEVNRYVKGWGGGSALEVLHRFDRWPTWMWANWEIVRLASWMREHNDALPDAQKVGFYGLDVYSLWESLTAVVQHLQEAHPDAVDDALQAVQCFEPFNRDAQEYAWHTRFGLSDCASEVVELLRELRGAPAKHPDDPEAHFNAEMNAHALIGAETYYRTMIGGSAESWNVRDTHMADTLDRLLERYGRNAKAIVWEHNTHIGDARATDMAEEDMVNIGQLARERIGDVALVGFGSYEGSVIAGRKWGALMERMPMPRGRPGSWEDLLHSLGGDRLLFSSDLTAIEEAMQVRGHRAIGVVYNPEREFMGNYVPTVLPQRYDAFLFIDRTQALHPLHITPHAALEPPETYPWGVSGRVEGWKS